MEADATVGASVVIADVAADAEVVVAGLSAAAEFIGAGSVAGGASFSPLQPSENANNPRLASKRNDNRCEHIRCPLVKQVAR